MWLCIVYKCVLTRRSPKAHAKINWIFSHADGVQCNQIGYPPCYTLAPTAIPVFCPKFKCVRFDLTAIGLSPAAPPSAAYPRSPYMYFFTPRRDRILSKANVIYRTVLSHRIHNIHIPRYVHRRHYYRVQVYIYFYNNTIYAPWYTIIMSSSSSCGGIGIRLFRYLHYCIVIVLSCSYLAGARISYVNTSWQCLGAF